MALSSLGAISLRTENMSTNSLKLRFPIPSSEKDSTILLRNGFSYGGTFQGQHILIKIYVNGPACLYSYPTTDTHNRFPFILYLHYTLIFIIWHIITLLVGSGMSKKKHTDPSKQLQYTGREYNLVVCLISVL